MSEKPTDNEHNLGEWLRGNGPDADVAVCTRVRFARNVQGFRFSTTMGDDDAEELLAYLEPRINRIEDGLLLQSLSGLDELDRRLMLERHLISREMAAGDRPRAVAVNDPESISVMLNEEDHVRAQVFAAGNSIAGAYATGEQLDAKLMEQVPLAFSEEFGFLTSCPTNTGTGMRVSVMLHLPGLVWADEIERATNATQKTNMAVRGLYGEGSRATGDFYQVSNQVTLGKTEQDILDDVGDAVKSLIAWERKVRDALITGDSETRTADRIFRSLGTIERARILSTEEALTCLSAVRFGIRQGLIDDIDVRAVHSALLLSQPGHLQRVCKRTLDAEERDTERADLVRRLLAVG